MANPKAHPLYPTYKELQHIRLEDYPQLVSLLDSGESWWRGHWIWGCEFLKYIGRNKSEHTYTRFRNETERFLLWLFQVKHKPMDELRKSDILEYADFCWQPPVSWICLANHEKFIYRDGTYKGY